MTESERSRYASFVPRSSRAREALWLCNYCGSDRQSPEELGLQPDVVTELARAHRLSAVAGFKLHAAQAVSTEWQRTMVRDWRQALGDETLFGSELERIDAAMSRAGIRFVLLKGADLARRGIYHPGQRTHNDLDLLIEPRDRDVVHRLLKELGFHSDHPAPDAAARHWFASTYRHSTQARVQLDLHWDLGAPGRGEWNITRVMETSEPLGEWRAARRLCRADLWAHLALHAVAYHGAAGRWIWWLDIHRLHQQSPVTAGEWEMVRARGAEIALQAALLRAAGLFDPRRFADLETRWRARAVARWGARFERGGDSRLKRWLIGALSLDRPSDLGLAAMSVARRLSDSVRAKKT